MGNSAQKNPPGKSPAKSSKIYTTKIPDTFLQRGQAKNFQARLTFSILRPFGEEVPTPGLLPMGHRKVVGGPLSRPQVSPSLQGATMRPSGGLETRWEALKARSPPLLRSQRGGKIKTGLSEAIKRLLFLIGDKQIAYHCDPSRHYRSLRTLRARNRKKNRKKGLLEGLQKSPKKYPKKSKNTQKVRKSVFLDFSGYFLRLFCGPPKRPFLRLFCDFGPGRSRDSCKWQLGSQAYLTLITEDLF